VDGVASFTCACFNGYGGERCQTHIEEVNSVDDCARHPCANGGTCVDGVASFTCICANGYEGEHCEHVDKHDDCAEVSHTCNYGSRCSGGPYAGVHCDHDRDCHPCGKGGTCVDGVASFTCACFNGYGGERCQTHIEEVNSVDDCARHPCANGGTCVDGVASFTCTCANGYEGERCQEVYYEEDHNRVHLNTLGFVTLFGAVIVTATMLCYLAHRRWRRKKLSSPEQGRHLGLKEPLVDFESQSKVAEASREPQAASIRPADAGRSDDLTSALPPGAGRKPNNCCQYATDDEENYCGLLSCIIGLFIFPCICCCPIDRRPRQGLTHSNPLIVQEHDLDDYGCTSHMTISAPPDPPTATTVATAMPQQPANTCVTENSVKL